MTAPIKALGSMLARSAEPDRCATIAKMNERELLVLLHGSSSRHTEKEYEAIRARFRELALAPRGWDLDNISLGGTTYTGGDYGA